MSAIPRDPWPDSTLALLRDGYTFIPKRCERYRSDLFETRLMLQRAVCVHGPEAAEVFYDPARFRRADAVPGRVRKTLFGEGAVQGLDDAAHRQRKELFLSLVGPEGVARLAGHTAEEWDRAVRRWEAADRVVLFDAAGELMCRAACAWAGVPLSDAEAADRARDFVTMVDAFGGVGLRNWRGRRARKRAEAWIAGVIEERRAKGPDGDDPAGVVARYRGPDGRLPDARVAAVELINLIRPTTAIAWYVAFAGLALHQHPAARRHLEAGDDRSAGEVVDEVRRFYPFAPFLGARVRADFEWRGYRFREGTLVLLDVYGAHHDPRLWDRPEEFRPDRFRDRVPCRFDLIPHGGGESDTGHRCAGEQVTTEALKVALRYLTRGITYEVPPQDLSYSLSRMPTLPASGFVMARVRRAGPG
jgi:fatty-acid peroxygenase